MIYLTLIVNKHSHQSDRIASPPNGTEVIGGGIFIGRLSEFFLNKYFGKRNQNKTENNNKNQFEERVASVIGIAGNIEQLSKLQSVNKILN